MTSEAYFDQLVQAAIYLWIMVHLHHVTVRTLRRLNDEVSRFEYFANQLRDRSIYSAIYDTTMTPRLVSGCLFNGVIFQHKLVSVT